MHLDINFGYGVLSLPEKTAELLKDMSHSEIRLLVYIASDKQRCTDFSETDASVLLGLSENEIRIALGKLVDMGLVLHRVSEDKNNVTVRTKQVAQRGVTVVKAGVDTPSYTGAEIESLFSQRSELGRLVEDCQRILGKMFTLIEINRVINLADQYRLSCDYITTLCLFAVKIGRPTVPYVEKTALGLYNDGIVSLSELEIRLAEMEEISTLESFVRKLFGLGTRKLTSKESKFIEQWVRMKYSQEMIELAYEIAVNNTSSPSMPYTNKTLINWSEAGYATPEQALAALEKFRSTKNDNLNSGQNGRNISDPLEEAILASSKSRARKLLGDNGDNGESK
ncbi:MAG: DnaD domain protein [Clostridia bacterium]|nr:DnaD domain protein [Clostridia bacterium]